MSDDDAFFLLMQGEVDARHRVLELRAARLRRLEERVAGRTGEVTYWVGTDEEDEEDQALQAYGRFPPVRWWEWTPEEWAAHESPADPEL